MGTTSKIEWTDASWTPIRARHLATGKVGWYCEHATTGCEFCYAETMNKRLGTGLPFKPGHRKDIEIFLDEKMLLAPLNWKKPRLVFVCSMTDAFADFVKDEWLDQMFAVMALCPQHTFQVLTKRAERMKAYMSAARAHPVGLEALGLTLDAHARDANSTVGAGCILQGDIAHLKIWPLPNVWLGVSCERQKEADERIPLLLQTPAAVRFISAEPLLGPIDLRKAAAGYMGMNALVTTATRPRLDWAIVGGESGPHARPMHPQWTRDLRDQCAAASVPFFFKQWGEWAPSVSGMAISPDASSPRPDRWNHESTAWMERVGKKKAGRMLDGVEHSEFPTSKIREAA